MTPTHQIDIFNIFFIRFPRNPFLDIFPKSQYIVPRWPGTELSTLMLQSTKTPLIDEMPVCLRTQSATNWRANSIMIIRQRWLQAEPPSCQEQTHCTYSQECSHESLLILTIRHGFTSKVVWRSAFFNSRHRFKYCVVCILDRICQKGPAKDIPVLTVSWI